MISMKSSIIILILGILASHYSFAQQPKCDYKVEILTDSKEFYKEDFKWRMKATKLEGNSTNLTGTAEITLNGKIVKSYTPWKFYPISRQRTSNEYSPNLDAGEYKITAEISVACNDTNKDNNFDSKTIKIKNNETNNKKIPINSDEYGKILIADNSKNVETIKSEIANQTFQTISAIQSKTNEKVEGNNSENIIQLKADKNQKSGQLPTTEGVKIPRIAYESSNEKAKNWIMIFLLMLSIFINIVLIWRR